MEGFQIAEDLQAALQDPGRAVARPGFFRAKGGIALYTVLLAPFGGMYYSVYPTFGSS